MRTYVELVQIPAKFADKMKEYAPGGEDRPIVVRDHVDDLSKMGPFPSIAALRGAIHEQTAYFELGDQYDADASIGRERWILDGSPPAHGDPIRLPQDEHLGLLVLMVK